MLTRFSPGNASRIFSEVLYLLILPGGENWNWWRQVSAFGHPNLIVLPNLFVGLYFNSLYSWQKNKWMMYDVLQIKFHKNKKVCPFFNFIWTMTVVLCSINDELWYCVHSFAWLNSVRHCWKKYIVQAAWNPDCKPCSHQAEKGQRRLQQKESKGEEDTVEQITYHHFAPPQENPYKKTKQNKTVWHFGMLKKGGKCV